MTQLVRAEADDGAPMPPTPASARHVRRRRAASLLWTLLESGSLTALSLLTLIVFARLLTPAELGSAALGLSIVQILGMPVIALFQDALVQRRDAAPGHFDTAFTVSLALGAVLAALCWAEAERISALVQDPAAGTALRWMSLCLPLQALESVLIARQRRELRFRDLALCTVLGRLCAGLAAIVIALAGGGIWAPIAQQVLSVLLSAGVLYWSVAERIGFRFDPRAFRELFHFGIRELGTNGLVVAIPRIFLMQVAFMLGTEAAGYANLAFRMVDTLRDVLVTAIWRLSLPVFSRLGHARRLLRRALTGAIEDTSAMVFPLFAGLAAVTPELVATVFGPAWSPALPYMLALSAVALLFLVRIHLWVALTALGHPHYPIPGLLLEAAVILAWPPLAPFSALAAPLAWVVRAALALPVDAWMLRRASGIPIAAQFEGLAVLLFASLAMAGGVVALGAVLPGGMPAWLRLALLMASGAVLYGALIMLIRPGLVRRLLAFARQANRHAAAR